MISYRQADLLSAFKKAPWQLNIYSTPTQVQGIFSLDPKYRAGVEFDIDEKYLAPFKGFDIKRVPNAWEIQCSIGSTNPHTTVRRLVQDCLKLGLVNQIPLPENYDPTHASVHWAKFQIPKVIKKR
jgi:hypothetical protein